jgi:hypothetical protein
MGKVTIEFDEEDLEKLFDTQYTMLEVMLRIEGLLKEIKNGNDAGSQSKKSRSKPATKS